MALPNVDDGMTSLSALQILPPPHHKRHISSSRYDIHDQRSTATPSKTPPRIPGRNPKYDENEDLRVIRSRGRSKDRNLNHDSLSYANGDGDASGNGSAHGSAHGSNGTNTNHRSSECNAHANAFVQQKTSNEPAHRGRRHRSLSIQGRESKVLNNSSNNSSSNNSSSNNNSSNNNSSNNSSSNNNSSNNNSSNNNSSNNNSSNNNSSNNNSNSSNSNNHNKSSFLINSFNLPSDLFRGKKMTKVQRTTPTKTPTTTIPIPPCKMFGNHKIYPRTLIPPTIHHNPATDLWIVTIRTHPSDTAENNNSVRPNTPSNLMAFSFHSEKAARASAYAHSPPLLHPLQIPSCMICDTPFSLLRRPKHCRNCGIVLCSNHGCSTRWNLKMLPDTYVRSSMRKAVRVCSGCDAMAKRFRHALLNGRYDDAVEVYLTGNVNPRCPFVVKDDKEIMFPIHCAILGQSEQLLRWLVDVQCCPIHVLPTATKDKQPDILPTLSTSKGRSVMDLAMTVRHSGILRYLVVEKYVSVYAVKDLGLVLGAVEALIREFPEEGDENWNGGMRSGERLGTVVGPGSKMGMRKELGVLRETTKNTVNPPGHGRVETPIPRLVCSPVRDKVLVPRDIQPVPRGRVYTMAAMYDSKSTEDDNADPIAEDGDDNSVSTTAPEPCVVCNADPIDCVATPCGHQSCCRRCSLLCTTCPSCGVECRFIKIYQP